MQSQGRRLEKVRPISRKKMRKVIIDEVENVVINFIKYLWSEGIGETKKWSSEWLKE